MAFDPLNLDLPIQGPQTGEGDEAAQHRRETLRDVALGPGPDRFTKLFNPQYVQCYFNCLVQALIFHPRVARAFRYHHIGRRIEQTDPAQPLRQHNDSQNDRGQLTHISQYCGWCSMYEVLVRYWTRPYTPINDVDPEYEQPRVAEVNSRVTKLLNRFQDFCKLTGDPELGDETQQQDAQEAYGKLIEWLQILPGQPESDRAPPSDLADALFKLKTKKEGTCLECGNIKHYDYQITDAVRLNFHQPGESNIPITYSQSELLSKEGKDELNLECTKCLESGDGPRTHNVQLKVYQWPELLLIQLGLWSWDFEASKHNDTVKIEEYLNMMEYGMTDQDVKYRLYCVVVHIGEEAKEGHYICYIRNPVDETTWIECDDLPTDNRNFWKVDFKAATIFDHERGETPYLLFYEKVHAAEDRTATQIHDDRELKLPEWFLKRRENEAKAAYNKAEDGFESDPEQVSLSDRIPSSVVKHVKKMKTKRKSPHTDGNYKPDTRDEHEDDHHIEGELGVDDVLTPADVPVDAIEVAADPITSTQVTVAVAPSGNVIVSTADIQLAVPSQDSRGTSTNSLTAALPSAYQSWTKKKLQSECSERNITYTSAATKKHLIDLLDAQGTQIQAQDVGGGIAETEEVADDDYDKTKVADLKAELKSRDIKGYSRWKKEQCIEELRRLDRAARSKSTLKSTEIDTVEKSTATTGANKTGIKIKLITKTAGTKRAAPDPEADDEDSVEPTTKRVKQAQTTNKTANGEIVLETVSASKNDSKSEAVASEKDADTTEKAVSKSGKAKEATATVTTDQEAPRKKGKKRTVADVETEDAPNPKRPKKTPVEQKLEAKSKAKPKPKIKKSKKTVSVPAKEAQGEEPQNGEEKEDSQLNDDDKIEEPSKNRRSQRNKKK